MGTEIESIENDYVVAGMLRWETPLSGLSLSLTGFSLGDTTMKTGIGKIIATQYDVFVPSLLFEWENFTFSLEYRYSEQQMVLNDTILIIDRTVVAWHSTAAYRFTDWFELGLGYSEVYRDKDDKDGESFKKKGQPAGFAWRKDISVSTRFDINESWLFKLEGHCMNGLEGLYGDIGDDPDEDWFLFAAKTTFSF